MWRDARDAYAFAFAFLCSRAAHTQEVQLGDAESSVFRGAPPTSRDPYSAVPVPVPMPGPGPGGMDRAGAEESRQREGHAADPTSQVVAELQTAMAEQEQEMLKAKETVMALAGQAETARADNEHLTRKLSVMGREFQIAREQHKLQVEEFDEHTAHHGAESAAVGGELTRVKGKLDQANADNSAHVAAIKALESSWGGLRSMVLAFSLFSGSIQYRSIP